MKNKDVIERKKLIGLIAGCIVIVADVILQNGFQLSVLWLLMLYIGMEYMIIMSGRDRQR